jgi:hypothetical protein
MTASTWRRVIGRAIRTFAPPKRRWLLVAAIIAVASVSVYIWVNRSTPVRVAGSDAARVAHPASTLLASGPSEFGGLPAYLHVFGSEEPIPAISDYYDAALNRLGFIDGAGMASVPTTDELYTCAWHGDDLVVRLAFIDRDEAVQLYPDIPSVQEYRTVYRWLVVDLARTLEPYTCPPP